MRLLRALTAFYRAFVETRCRHAHLDKRAIRGKTTLFCPDCGYPVRLQWTFCRCRTCGAKRPSRQDVDGQIRTRHRYCQYCGQTDYRLIQKERIHLYDLPYAVLSREIDYRELSHSDSQASPSFRANLENQNPFEISRDLGQTLDIVEGVLMGAEDVRLNGAF